MFGANPQKTLRASEFRSQNIGRKPSESSIKSKYPPVSASHLLARFLHLLPLLVTNNS
jgi:hypothetical protein